MTGELCLWGGQLEDTEDVREPLAQAVEGLSCQQRLTHRPQTMSMYRPSWSSGMLLQARRTQLTRSHLYCYMSCACALCGLFWGPSFRILPSLVTLVASLPRELEAVFGTSYFFASAALLCTPRSHLIHWPKRELFYTNIFLKNI